MHLKEAGPLFVRFYGLVELGKPPNDVKDQGMSDIVVLNLKGYICNFKVTLPHPSCSGFLCHTKRKSKCLPCLPGEYKVSDYPGMCVPCPAGT